MTDEKDETTEPVGGTHEGGGDGSTPPPPPFAPDYDLITYIECGQGPKPGKRRR